MKEIRVLFVEDSPRDAELLVSELSKGGYSLESQMRVETREDLMAALETGHWDMVLGDFSMPNFNGLEAVKIVRDTGQDLPYIMVSGSVGEELAVSAMKAGANDFFVKGDLRRLLPAVERELRESKSRKEREAARQQAEDALRNSEEQLRQAQRMESIGRLAGGIAHDFNNILSVVSGYASLLQLKLARGGQAHKELDEIDKAVARATSLVRQLLTFSRKQVVQPQILDLGTVVTESMSLLQIVLGEDIVVETRIEPGLDRIKADRGHMDQIVMNLAVNARDAMPNGGSLSLELRSCTLGAEVFQSDEKVAPGKYIRLAIRDTGHGMDRATLSRIFEPFFTTKPDGRGTGLGLSTVYGIVRQAGGIIRVQSAPKEGSSFHIYLPCTQEENGEDGPETGGHAGRPTSAKGETILLVEDDVSLRKLTKDILVMEGYRVLESRNPEEALGFARAKDLDMHLLLTDLIMPYMNGKDLSREVLAIRPGLHVVFMSGYTPEALMPHVTLSEHNFLEKPFATGKLLSCIRSVLDASG